MPDQELEPAPIRVQPTRWFDSSDLAAFYLLLIALPAVAAFGLIVLPVIDWIDGRSMVAAQTGQVRFPDATIDQLAGWDYSAPSATIYFDDPTAAQRLLGLVLPLCVIAALALGAFLLFRVANDIARGFAFSRANVNRLRWLGAVVAALAFLLGLGPSFAVGALMRTAPEIGDFDTSFNTGTMMLGVTASMAFTMLSQAFSVGSKLTEDMAEVI